MAEARALALLALLALGGPACRRAAEPRPNLVLVSVDALRADRLSLYGHAAPTSPNLDAWARARALTFTDASTPAPWTLPAHASLLSGLDPLRHGANWPFRSLSPDVPVLAERLRAAGYATAGVTGGGWLDPTFGLARGFERYRGARAADWRGDREWEEHARLAAEWLRTLPQPFFLFVHTCDVHDFPRAPRLPPDTPDAERARMYDEAVRHMDAQLGLLLAELVGERLRGRTAVVLTADHGEALGEQRDYGHGSLREGVLRVPLVVQPPGGLAPGRRDAGLARLVDVAPTLLEWAGLGPDPGLDGVSLVPRLRDAAAPAVRETLAYFPLGGGLAWREGALKCRFDDSAFAAPGARLFGLDLAADPGEAAPRRADALFAPLCARALARLRERATGLALSVDVPAGQALSLELHGPPLQHGAPRVLDEGTPALERLAPDAARWSLPGGSAATLLLAAATEGTLELRAGGAEPWLLDLGRLEAPAEHDLAGARVRCAWRGPRPRPAASPPEDVRERLRALGYLR